MMREGKILLFRIRSGKDVKVSTRAGGGTSGNNAQFVKVADDFKNVSLNILDQCNIYMKSASIIALSEYPSPSPSAHGGPLLSLVIFLYTKTDQSALVAPLCWPHLRMSA